MSPSVLRFLQILAASGVLLTSSLGVADMVDFENAGDYGGDDAIVTNDYISQYGLTFTAMAGSNEADAQLATLTFEASGRDGSDAYYSSGGGRDEAFSGDLGNYLIKAGNGNLSYSRSEYFKLSIDYIDPTTAASGELWDIDGPEQYQVTALDANGSAIATVTSPIGGLNAEPWAFSFDVGDSGVEIAQLDVEFIGNGTLRGFAFDNFNATEANPNVATTHAAPMPMSVQVGMIGLFGLYIKRRNRERRQQLAG